MRHSNIFTFALVWLLSLTVGAMPATAAKKAERVIGDRDAAGELLPGGGALASNPGDVAVDNATGRVFVADISFHRIQRFAADGTFERAWGLGVVAPGGSGDAGGVNEQQTIAVDATGGTFKVKFSARLPDDVRLPTGPIPFDASAAAVQAALEAHPSLSPGDVSVTGAAGGPWTVEFTGSLAATDIPSLNAFGSDTANLTGGASSVALSTPVPGISNYEICTVAAECYPGSVDPSAAPGGELVDPESLAFSPFNGHLYVSDRNSRITEFTADGEFVRTWGPGVVLPGGTGDVPTNEVIRLSFPSDPAPGFAKVVGGIFRLTFEGEQTGDIPFGASTAQVQAALDALPGVDPGDIAVTGPTGGPWSFEFAGDYADSRVSLDIDRSKLKNQDKTVGVEPAEAPLEVMIAAGGFEVCTVAAECRVGANHGAGPGQLGPANSPVPIAIGPDGSVFVGDPANTRLNQYEADGDFVRAWGWGVATEADAFEICTASSGCRRGQPAYNDEPNTENGQFMKSGILSQGNYPSLIAVDADGVLYANNMDKRLGVPEGPPRIERFDTTASDPEDLVLEPIRSAKPPAGTPGPVTEVHAMEVDQGNGNLYVRTNRTIDEIDPTGAGTLADTHLPGNPDFLTGGIGHDDGNDLLYVPGSSSGRIVVAGAIGVAAPIVELDPPEVTGPASATFSGEVTPGGPPNLHTLYRFEYKKASQASWTKLPSEEVDLGDGGTAIEVSHSIATLEPGVDYEVRLVARKEFGAAEAIDGPETFILGDLPPVVETLHPQRVSHDSATFSGTIDPQNLQTSYRFEWGVDTSYGNQVPVPPGTIEGDGTTAIAIDVDSLDPETTYHYRLVADNGVEVGPGVTEVAGDDVQFTTTSPADSEPPERGWEMVTPPFKFQPATTTPGPRPGENPNPGLPSLDGETLAWQSPIFPMGEEVGYSGSGDYRLFHRGEDGWTSETLNTLPLLEGLSPRLLRQVVGASSGDLLTQTVFHTFGPTFKASGGLLPTEGTTANRFYTRRPGTGVKGYTPWLTNPDAQVVGLPENIPTYNGGLGDTTVIDDAGTAMVRGGAYFDLADDPNTPADEDPTGPGVAGGIYLQRAADPDQVPSAPKQVVNACTGTGGSATQIPARIGDGSATDTIGAQACEEGEAIDARIGGDRKDEGDQIADSPAGGPSATALSEGGGRVFISGPDSGQGSCSAATGAATSCPTQLFVRQLNEEGGNPRLAWITRSRSVAGPDNSYSGPPIPGQQIGLLGPTGFQGASRDGRVVYFKTNAPLTPDDPNGTGTPGPKTGGTASDESWDLYRYELPEDLDEDPTAGSLTRVSGGPTGSADPGTNNSAATAAVNRPPGSGASLRYLSADGERAYFVTTSPIAGADSTPPTGGSTSPGGAVGNSETRNLYLFDAGASGADRYRFIAELPFFAIGTQGDLASAGKDARELNACASYSSPPGAHMASTPGHPTTTIRAFNCFRATPDGSFVAFFTAGQLTGDDNDEAGDIYLYDLGADRLTRVTTPVAASVSYGCNIDGQGEAAGVCNGDFGFGPGSFFSGTAGGDTDTSRGYAASRYNNVAVDEQGVVSVFFESRSELVSDDQNGDHWDVYQWREGQVSLISRAMPERHSYYSGSSLDGEDLFLFTSDRIDPREISPYDYDLYDYRVGGGFPYTPPPEPCNVLSGACESEAAPAPRPSAVATNANGPSGNVAKPRRRCAKGKVRRKARCVNARKAKGRRAGNKRTRGGRR